MSWLWFLLILLIVPNEFIALIIAIVLIVILAYTVGLACLLLLPFAIILCILKKNKRN